MTPLGFALRGVVSRRSRDGESLRYRLKRDGLPVSAVVARVAACGRKEAQAAIERLRS